MNLGNWFTSHLCWFIQGHEPSPKILPKWLPQNINNTLNISEKLFLFQHLPALSAVWHGRHWLKRPLFSSNAEAQREFDQWGMSFDNKLVKLKARVLPRESIYQGAKSVQVPRDSTACFSSASNWHAMCVCVFNNWSTSSVPRLQTGPGKVGACLWPALRPWRTGRCFTRLGTAVKLRLLLKPSTRSWVHWVLPFRTRTCESKPGVTNLFEAESYFMASESPEGQPVC